MLQCFFYERVYGIREKQKKIYIYLHVREQQKYSEIIEIPQGSALSCVLLAAKTKELAICYALHTCRRLLADNLSKMANKMASAAGALPPLLPLQFVKRFGLRQAVQICGQTSEDDT